jgi:aspartyl protease family protein
LFERADLYYNLDNYSASDADRKQILKIEKDNINASGDIIERTKVRLCKIKIGELGLNNIEASVVHKQNAPLLFGKSALGKFVNITIDNANNEIIFEY